MEDVRFAKMSGSGNDFIVIDDREGRLPEDLARLATRLCRRRLSVGADGLIVLVVPRDPAHHFRWHFYNADGSRAEMCGNGGRCAARYAVERGFAPPRVAFETDVGVITAQVSGARVRLRLVPPRDLFLDRRITVDGKEVIVGSVDTGVPHAVLFVEDLEGAEVERVGPLIRRHEAFAPRGTNVDFVRVLPGGRLAVRTYERGVEGETLACGTGLVASALLAAAHGWVQPPVEVETRGGEVLTVHIAGPARAPESVEFEGDVRLVYEGVLTPEALL